MSPPESTSERMLRELRERDKQLKDSVGNKGLRSYHSAVTPPPPSTRPSRTPPTAKVSLRAGRDSQSGRFLTTVEPVLTKRTTFSPSTTTSTTSHGREAQLIGSAAELGPIIRKARKRMKLSQKEFANHAGVGRRFLSELEGGKPSVEFDKVIQCARAAGIDLFARPRHG